ncbi:hypothetical protein FRC10_003914 [Ceratobasidium sp. 414]|nr:hypothetical protein FRC10_003914 [Ceratobasidium sp. 414]
MVAAAYQKLTRGQMIQVKYCEKPSSGSPARGADGYDLQGLLQMTNSGYNGVRNIIKLVFMRSPEIDMTKAYTQQRPKYIIKKITNEKIAPIFPEFDMFAADDHWQFEAFAQIVLRSSRNQFLNSLGRGNTGDAGDADMDDDTDNGVDGNLGKDMTKSTSEVAQESGWGYEDDVPMQNDNNYPPPEYKNDPVPANANDNIDDDGTADLVHNMSTLSVRRDHTMEVDPSSPPPRNMLPADLAGGVRAQPSAPRMSPEMLASPPQVFITTTATSTASFMSTSTATSTATSVPVPQELPQIPSRQSKAQQLASPQLVNRLQSSQ